MHDHLKAEVERMGYDSRNVAHDTHAEQDFLIMARLMSISRTGEFSEEELAYYQNAAEDAANNDHSFVRGRILTPDFSEEELHQYQWAAEHPTGSCRGFRMTKEPTEQEVAEWRESLDYLNNLNFDEARSRVKLIDKDETKPYEEDLHPCKFPGNSRVGPRMGGWENVVATCNLGNDPYSLRN